MPAGPGRYDDLTSYCRIEAQAEGVIVIIFGGKRGSGFACQTSDPDLAAKIPDLLEGMAKEIRQSLEENPPAAGDKAGS